VEEVIRFGKLIGHPLRIRLLVCLLQRELTKEELRRVFSKERESRVQIQLDVLRYAEIVISRPHQRSAAYSIDPEKVQFLEALVAAFRADIEWDRDISQDLARLARLE
jgi:DNA-binding transcriptional ArsR family regulator